MTTSIRLPYGGAWHDSAVPPPDRPDRPDEPDHWFEPLADHLGRAYLRYSFTKGTEQEVGALVDALELLPGQRVLDVGCGPGRHAHALARRGIEVVGVDISQRFVQLAREDDPLDADAGVNHERTAVRDEGGAACDADLWTTCFTPRELRLLAARAGLRVRAIWSVTPGAYAPAPPTIETPEFLLPADKPENPS